MPKFSALGNGIAVKSMNYAKCVIDFGPIASLKLGFCEQNVD